MSLRPNTPLNRPKKSTESADAADWLCRCSRLAFFVMPIGRPDEAPVGSRKHCHVHRHILCVAYVLEVFRIDKVAVLDAVGIFSAELVKGGVGSVI